MSYVINHRPLPPFEKGIPIVVAMVQLEEGPRMLSNIVDIEPDPDELELGMSLSVEFIPRGDQVLPMFRKTEAA